MIRVRAIVDDAGCLSSVSVSGHAAAERGPSGGSIVCAAVTGLVRSCAEAIARRPSITASGDAPGPGELRVEIHGCGSDGEWLRGVTDVMLCGVERMAGEAPDELELMIERTGVDHGA